METIQSKHNQFKEIPRELIPIIRCKDCKYCFRSSLSSTHYKCKQWGLKDGCYCETDEDGYCYRGEQRE